GSGRPPRGRGLSGCSSITPRGGGEGPNGSKSPRRPPRPSGPRSAGGRTSPPRSPASTPTWTAFSPSAGGCSPEKSHEAGAPSASPRIARGRAFLSARPPRHRSLLHRADRGFSPSLLHRLRHLRDRRSRQRPVRRAGELRRARPRPALLDRLAQHDLFRLRRRSADAGGRSRRRAAAALEVRPLEGILPHGLLRAVRDDPRRRRDRLPLSLPPALRAARPRARLDRNSADRLARRPALGDAGDHPARRLEELRLRDDPLHRGAWSHSRVALRGRAHRWRRAVADLPEGDAAASLADVSFPRRDDGDRVLPVLRRTLCHDQWRAVERDPFRRPADVPPGIPLVEHGLRGGDRLRPVPARGRGVGHPVRAPEEARGVRSRAGTILLHAALAAIAVVSLAPLAWMVSASMMPTGEANSYPPAFLPSKPTLDHYRDLFTRLSLGRAFATRLILPTPLTPA